MNEVKEFFLKYQKIILSTIKWLFLILFFVIIINLIDLNDFRETLASVRFTTIAAFTLLLGVSKLLYAVRWQLINSAINPQANIPWKVFLSTNLLAEFVSIALPSSIGGEVVRFAKINPHNQNGWKTSFGIFVDRLMGVATMLAGSFFLILLMGDEIKSFFGRKLAEVNWALTIMLMAIATLITVFLAVKFYSKKKEEIDLETFRKAARDKWPQLTLAVFISLLSHFSFSASHLVIFRQLFPLPFISALGVVLVPQLAKSIPISLFGISGSEGLMIFGQMLVGLPENTAVVITFISLFARYIYAALGLVIELLQDGWSFINAERKKAIQVNEPSDK